MSSEGRVALATGGTLAAMALLSGLLLWIVAGSLEAAWHSALGSVAIAALAAGLVGRQARRGEDDVKALEELLADLTRENSFSIVPKAPVADRLWTRTAHDFAMQVDELRLRYRELARAEAAARKSMEDAQRLKNRFMAYMSHDLKSPLNSILGFTEVLALETDGPLNPPQLENVEIIRTSGEELLRLVTDIVDFSRLEAGRLLLLKEWTPSVAILNEAVARFVGVAAHKGVAIEREIQPGLPPLYVDSARIAQALMALISFMLRFMQGGTLLIRAHVGPDREWLWIEVLESQPGIRAEDSIRMRDIVSSSEPRSRRPVGGHGLSLKLARELVDRHSGAIMFEQTSAPLFRITLSLSGPS